jgi:hypothetical protein
MAIAKTPRTNASFKPFVMEFFDAATTKGDLTQEGAASFLVQERKAENEECF